MIIKRLKLEQREYGKVTRYLPKSIAKHIDTKTRPLKYKIGKWRRNEGIRQEQKILDSLKEAEALKREAINEGPINNRIKRDLVDNLPSDLKGRVKVLEKHDPDLSHDAFTTINKGKSRESELKRINDRIQRYPAFPVHKDYKSALLDKSNKAIIVHSQDTGPAGIAHELGHSQNRLSGSISDKIISRLDNPGMRGRHHSEEPLGIGKDHSIKETLQSIYDRGIILKEEKNASKKAMKILKDKGMSKEELKETRKSLDQAYKTYKVKADAKVSTNLRSKIQIPSRKNLTPSDNVSYARRLNNKSGYIEDLGYRKKFADKRKLK